MSTFSLYSVLIIIWYNYEPNLSLYASTNESNSATGLKPLNKLASVGVRQYLVEIVEYFDCLQHIQGCLCLKLQAVKAEEHT